MSTVGARAALNLSGTMLGYYPLRVLPSKTAIAPVNPTFLPRVIFLLRDSYCRFYKTIYQSVLIFFIFSVLPF
jgi:hypothetical protein